MDKIFSTRIDESVVKRIELIARELGKSKKAVVEGAIQMFAEKVEKQKNIDPLECTWGAWKRKEKPGPTVKKTRETFQKSMLRHQ